MGRTGAVEVASAEGQRAKLLVDDGEQRLGRLHPARVSGADMRRDALQGPSDVWYPRKVRAGSLTSQSGSSTTRRTSSTT